MGRWTLIAVLGVALVVAPPATARPLPPTESVERCCQPLTLQTAARVVRAWTRHYDDAHYTETRCHRLSGTVVKCHPIAYNTIDPTDPSARAELIVYADVTVTLRRGVVRVHDTLYKTWRVPRRFL